jgi:hypothetical protein
MSSTRNAARRLAAGALITTLFVGATGAPALALEPTVGTRTAVSSQYTWPTGSPSETGTQKSTPARWLEDNGADYSTGTLVKVGAVWAAAAAIVMAGVMGGSLLNRRR